MKRLLLVILLIFVLIFSCIQVSAKSEGYGPYFSSIESYNSYFSKNKMQDWFITAQELEFMGSFVSFNVTAPNYGRYTYRLKDNNDTEFTVTVSHGTNDNWAFAEIMQMPETIQDMRYLQPNSTPGVIERNSVMYVYEEEEGVIQLSYIAWRIEDTFFKDDTFFHIDCSLLPDSIGEEETFLNLLLSASDAGLEKAMAMFETGITVSNDKFIVVKVIAIVVGCLAFSAGAVIVVIRCRKRYLRRKYAYFDIEI